MAGLNAKGVTESRELDDYTEAPSLVHVVPILTLQHSEFLSNIILSHSYCFELIMNYHLPSRFSMPLKLEA